MSQPIGQLRRRLTLAVLSATMLVVWLAAVPAQASEFPFEFRPSWGVAAVDKHPFAHPATGGPLAGHLARVRGSVMDAPEPDGTAVRLRVWAIDAKGKGLATRSFDEKHGVNRTFDVTIDVYPKQIAYLRFDFCRAGTQICEPSYRPSRPRPKPTPEPAPAPVPPPGPLQPSHWGDRILPAGWKYSAGKTIELRGQQPDTGVWWCTSAFVAKTSSGLRGLSAGHCGHLLPRPTVVRLRGGAIIGDVDYLGFREAFGTDRAGDLDVLSFRLPDERYAQEVDRGAKLPPLKITEWVPTASQEVGQRICFTGAASGIDQCGKVQSIDESRPCTDAVARHGDSGGPVYSLNPRNNGEGQAVGIAVSIQHARKSADGVESGGMCYVPIQAILNRLQATLVDTTRARSRSGSRRFRLM